MPTKSKLLSIAEYRLLWGWPPAKTPGGDGAAEETEEQITTEIEYKVECACDIKDLLSDTGHAFDCPEGKCKK